MLQIPISESWKLKKYSAGENSDVPSLTVPDKGITPAQALKRFQNNTLQKNLDNFYDGEMEVPDVKMMTQLERLHIMAQYREDFKAKKDAFEKGQERLSKKQKEAEAKRVKDSEPKTQSNEIPIPPKGENKS